MKKFYAAFVLLLIFALGGSVFADVVQTQRRIRPQNQNTQQNRQNGGQASPKVNNYNKNQKTGDKLVDNVRMCKPYTETLNTDVAGLNFSFKVSIEGWVDNKCRLNFVAQSTGISDTFKQLYGVDSSMASIFTFEPKIRCDFTKQQLLEVGDSILQENERNAGATNNMLKNPMSIEMPTMSNMNSSDMRLMDVLLNDRACTILNAGDSAGMFNSLFGM